MKCRLLKFKKLKSWLAPTKREPFKADITYKEIDEDALDFYFAEAEKYLASTREAITSLNQRSQSYITFNALGISGLFAFLGFIVTNGGLSQIHIYLLYAAIGGAFFLLGSIACCIIALKLTNVAFIGGEPKDILRDCYIKNKPQLKVAKYVSTLSYQDQININKDTIRKKATWLKGAYMLVFLGLFSFCVFIGRAAVTYDSDFPSEPYAPNLHNPLNFVKEKNL